MSTRFRRCICILVLIAGTSTHGVHAQALEAIADRFELATAAFREGQMNEAYGRFVDLANRGHAPSMEIALFMYEHGATLFGREWELAPYQLTGWGRTRERDLVSGRASVPGTVTLSK